MKIQDLPCVLGAIQDITERKRNELELMEAIETVMQDTSWFSRTVIEKLAQIRAPGAPQSQGELADLTRREREILGLICDGHTPTPRSRPRCTCRATRCAIMWRRCTASWTCTGAAPPSSGRASAASWATRNRRASGKRGAARAGCSGAIHQTSRKVPVDLVRAFLTRARRHSYIGFVRGHGLQAARRAISPQLEPRSNPMDNDRIKGAAKEVKGAIKKRPAS